MCVYLYSLTGYHWQCLALGLHCLPKYFRLRSALFAKVLSTPAHWSVRFIFQIYMLTFLLFSYVWRHGFEGRAAPCSLEDFRYT